MELRINIKPERKEYSYKNDIRSYLARKRCIPVYRYEPQPQITLNNVNKAGYRGSAEETIYLYNYTYYKRKKHHKRHHYEFFIYKIPMSLLRAMAAIENKKIVVTQSAKYFKIDFE